MKISEESICRQCAKSFQKSMYQSNLYCTRICYNEYRKNQQRDRLIKQHQDGVINGRTIKEHKYHIYSKRAIARGIRFELSINQFLEMWQLPCIYCGSDIETIGVDRVDNTRGYVLDNVTPCCTTCNLMKRGMNAQAFISHCKRIK